MKVKYILRSNEYLTNGKIYDAKPVENEHGPMPLYGIINDKGQEAVVAADGFEVVES